MLSTIGAGIFGSVPLSVRAAEEEVPSAGQEGYEARIGDVSYAELEAAFAAAQSGDVITVLKDCSVSETLRVIRDNITLKSENADAPVTVSRDEGFTGKAHGVSSGSVLISVTGGSLTTQDIILDGGAVLDDALNNSGSTWKSALVYVDGAYTMESGTVLQNNHIADGINNGLYTAGGVYVASEGTLVMDGGLIQNCYTSGSGGGVKAEENAAVTAASSTIRNCHALSGGGMDLEGMAELTGMILQGMVHAHPAAGYPAQRR